MTILNGSGRFGIGPESAGKEQEAQEAQEGAEQQGSRNKRRGRGGAIKAGIQNKDECLERRRQSRAKRVCGQTETKGAVESFVPRRE
ncbi:hypothetical protein PBY51_016496 [Eleginops maclovinus]|uniref:Uncharacterized protein n=1 Tax=Eleginops maclovinus TaxID=56733 RepID=A0AAN7XRF4_ELEMC|nr:hypothetical protein PBY51_016496 [Eleginops maclovinus]